MNRRDELHAWAAETFSHLHPPLLTCEPVLTEVSFLLRRAGGVGAEVVSLLRKEVLRIAFRLEDEAETVERLMNRYRQVPMSLADACLVRMSELHPRCRLFTSDSDFRIYRRHGRQVIPLLTPPET
ncbi:MAG: type II toxin-antitoxin system VapC family toxin [Candidatus Binatia bacterium]